MRENSVTKAGMATERESVCVYVRGEKMAERTRGKRHNPFEAPFSSPGNNYNLRIFTVFALSRQQKIKMSGTSLTLHASCTFCSGKGDQTGSVDGWIG